MTELEVGDKLEVTVDAVAHGGHCVARYSGIVARAGAPAPARATEPSAGIVLFVRHALPGERVVAEVTEVRRGYLRADAVTVLEPSPDRVDAPCPYAGPDRCGGCDLQHVAADAQRAWKADVIREQLQRLAGLPWDVRVEALPGGLLGWRSRVRYAVSFGGVAGLLKHRSHEVVPVDRCRIAHPAIQELDVTSRSWPDADQVEVVASSAGDVVVAAPGERVRERAVGRQWTLDASTFWQVHPSAPDVLAGAVLELLAPRPGQHVWDLYGGAGLFAVPLAEAVGPQGTVTLVESSAGAVADARANLSDLPQVTVIRARVDGALKHGLPPPDLVVLDPPRSGAGSAVVAAIATAAPRAVAYVACDPAAFARDVRTFREAGWRLADLRAYDCFPMTHHVECVGLLLPDVRDL